MQRLVVATPYSENSIIAMARTAAAQGDLDRFYTTLYLAGLSGGARRIPGRAGEWLTRELQLRAFAGIPDFQVGSLAFTMEMICVLTRRLGKQRTVNLTNRLMY
jgi:hypothetical protein